MPKKTKKEKLLAERRRKILPPAPAGHSSINADASSPFSVTLPASSLKPSPRAVVAVDDFPAIKRDLTKSLIITAVIIMGEILLARYLPR